MPGFFDCQIPHDEYDSKNLCMKLEIQYGPICLYGYCITTLYNAKSVRSLNIAMSMRPYDNLLVSILKHRMESEVLMCQCSTVIVVMREAKF